VRRRRSRIMTWRCEAADKLGEKVRSENGGDC
jgi:hypothetical protein